MHACIEAQLECARTHIADTLTELCTIYSPPADSGGEDAVVLYPDGWTVIASAIPCRLALSAYSGLERMEAAGVKATHQFVIHLDWDASLGLVINKTSRVRITTNNNRDFEVRGVPDVTGPRVTRVLEVDERT